MFLFRKKRKQKKRRIDESSNLEIIDENKEFKKVSLSDYKTLNDKEKEQINLENIVKCPIKVSVKEDSLQISRDEESLTINECLNVTPDPVTINEKNNANAYLTNFNKSLWICYRIVASYPLNYVITHSMGFLGPQETIKIHIKFLSLPEDQESVYCFAEEHAIMIQWFFLMESEITSSPKYFFMRQYHKSNWRSKVIRCTFLEKCQKQ
uniref:Fibronectin type-III domain-containing protein n=1 Tax=Strongyloides papillosus TaxID=174720 RepID=A0A0N5BE90_STREA